MKKSYLIFLLCLLFCGQMFAQKPPIGKNSKVVKPIIGKNSDAPAEPHQRCDILNGYSYNLEIDAVYWGLNPFSFMEVVRSMDNKIELKIESFPGLSFNLVQINLSSPKNGFRKYTFSIDKFIQIGSSDPTLLLFTHDSGLVVKPIYDADGMIEGFEVGKGPEISGATANLTDGGIGGVATVAAVETRVIGKQIKISVIGKELILNDGSTCTLGNITTSFPPE